MIPSHIRVAARYLTKDGLELTFSTPEKLSAYGGESAGWVLYKISASSEKGDEGYIKVSYIPLEQWNQLYVDLPHYLNTRLHMGVQLDGPGNTRLNGIQEIVDKQNYLNLAQNLTFKKNPVIPLESMDSRTRKRWEINLIKVLGFTAEGKYYEKFRSYHLDKPQVDYSKATRQGMHVGASLYNEAAKWLATKGLSLWSSGTQSPEAKHLWETLIPDPGGHVGEANGRKYLSFV